MRESQRVDWREKALAGEPTTFQEAWDDTPRRRLPTGYRIDEVRPEYSSSGATVQVTVTMNGHENWPARVTYELVGGNLYVTELCFRAKERTDPDSASMVMRRLQLGKLEAHIERTLRDPQTLFFLPNDWITAIPGRKRPGRAGRSPLWYALKARDYVQACHEHPDRPIQHLARSSHDSENTWRTWLHRARNLGLLTQSDPGRSGGELTASALELLKQSSEPESAGDNG